MIALRNVFIKTFFLTALVISGPCFAFSQEETVDHFSVVAEHLSNKTFFCHDLSLVYYDGFPAQTTLASTNPQNYLTGKITSAEYKSATFNSIGMFIDGTKRVYFLPYDGFNFDNVPSEDIENKPLAEYTGHIRIDAQVAVEDYDPQKHGKWKFDDFYRTAPGTRPVRPIRYQSYQYEPEIKSFDTVVYEICQVKWFIPVKRPEVLESYKIQYPDFPFEDRDGFFYPEGFTPTFYGYFYSTQTEYSNFNVTALNLLLDLGSALPIIGTTVSLHECKETFDVLSCGSFALDFASDVLFISSFRAIRLAGKLANAASKSNDAAKICSLLSKAGYASITIGAGNLTIAGLYAHKGEYLKGLGRLGASVGDIATGVFLLKSARRFGGGKIGTVEVIHCKDSENLGVNYKVEKEAGEWFDDLPAKSGSYKEALLDEKNNRVIYWPFAKWGEPNMLAKTYVKLSDDALGFEVIENGMKIKIIKYTKGGTPETFTAPYVKGTKLSWETATAGEKSAMLKALEKMDALMDNKYDDLVINDRVFYKMGKDAGGNDYIAWVDDTNFSNFVRTDEGLTWIDPWAVESLNACAP